MNSRENGYLAHFATICLCLAVADLMGGKLHGQTAITGQPVVESFTGIPMNSPEYLDALQFKGTTSISTPFCPGNVPPLTSDMCGWIQAAICYAPASGAGPLRSAVTVDARGFAPTSPATSILCGSNPFATPTDPSAATLTPVNVTLLLPPWTIDTTATWFLPAHTKVIGQNHTVTTIHWMSTAPLPSGNCTSGLGFDCVPVICMGSPTQKSGKLYCDTPGGNVLVNTPRTQVSGLRIDCDASSSLTVGLADITAQEQSWFQNGGTVNCANAGVYIGPTGTNSGVVANQVQNSGPWTNLEINWGTNYSAANTYGMLVDGGPSITIGVGGHITFNKYDSISGSGPNTALSVSGLQPSVADIHCENYAQRCVYVGEKEDTMDVSVHNITTTNTVPSAVEIYSTHKTTGVVSAVEAMGNNSIKDNQSNFTSTSPSLSSYVIGPGPSLPLQANNFVAHGSSVIDSIGNYNGVPTAGIGVTTVYGTRALILQNGSLTTTSILGSPALAGQYIVHYYADQSTACGSGTSGSVQFTFNWTDGTTARSLAPAPLMLTPPSIGPNFIQGVIPIFSSNPTLNGVTLSAAVSGTCATGTYDVHVSAEQTATTT